jgi:hypothetical protein
MVVVASPVDKSMGEVFFGVKKTAKFFLDKEKTQYVEYKKLTEGERIEFQDKISGKVTLEQATGKAEIESKTGSDRKALINVAVCGFKVMFQQGEEAVEVSDMARWDELYNVMDGDMAEKLYEEISVFNGFKKK